MLWASTSTKNPAYPDTLYVDPLIGPDTVNTMPQATIDAYLDHGQPQAGTVTSGLDQARAHFTSLAAAGISLDEITSELLVQGVASFSASYDKLLSVIANKMAKLAGVITRLPKAA